MQKLHRDGKTQASCQPGRGNLSNWSSTFIHPLFQTKHSSGFGPPPEPPAAGEQIAARRSRLVAGDGGARCCRGAEPEDHRRRRGRAEEGRWLWIRVGLLLWFGKAHSFILLHLVMILIPTSPFIVLFIRFIKKINHGMVGMGSCFIPDRSNSSLVLRRCSNLPRSKNTSACLRQVRFSMPK